MASGYFDEGITFTRDDDLLLSTKDIQPITIVVDKAVLDATNPEGSSILRAGLVLTQITASKKYTNHVTLGGDGSEIEANAVVLSRRVDMGDASADMVTMAYFTATLRASRLIVDDSAGFDWTLVPRLLRR